MVQARTHDVGHSGRTVAEPSPHRTRIRVLRIIARMNVGGPAQHVALLSGRLDPQRYDTLLVSGSIGPGEASMERLAALHGAQLHVVPALRPEIRPAADVVALTR